MMNRIITATLCLLVIMCLFSSMAYAVTYNAGGLVFNVAADNQNMTINNTGDFTSISNYIAINDGQTGNALNIGTNYSGLTPYVTYTADANKLSIKLEFRNQGTSQRWIETGMRLISSSNTAWKYWDGYKVHTSTSGMNLSRNEVLATFPAVAQYTSNTGICIGLEPMQLISYISSSDQSTNGTTGTLNHRVRIVIDAGTSVFVEYIIFGFSGADTELGVIQRYCDAYPIAFNATSGIDQRILTPGSHYEAWGVDGTITPEYLRRNRGGWEWCFAPFKRTGDIYCKQEYWDYTPAFPPFKDAGHLGIETCTTAQIYRDRRTSVFANRGRNYNNAMMFFQTSCLWCEEQLANQQYASARVNEAGHICSYNAWVTGNDKDVRVFPGNNAWGDVCKADLTAILAENDIAGFAFDVASAEVPVHQSNTPSVALSPGRAYDSQGVFVLEAVEVARMMDFVHAKTTLSGKVAGIVSNLGSWGNFMTAFRSDATLAELPSLDKTYGPIKPTRYLMGRKPINYWPYLHTLEKSLDFDSIPANQVLAVEQGLADYYTLEYLAQGTFPGLGISIGFKYKGIDASKLNYLLDALPDMVQRGFNPAPKMSAENNSILLSRYGSAERSCIGAGNPTASAYSGTISITNSANGGRACIYAGYKGESMSNSTTSTTSSITANIASKAFLIGKAVISIDTPSGTISSQASVSDTLSEINSTVTFNTITSNTYTIRGEIPSGYNLSSVKVNGVTKTASVSGNIFTCNTALASGDVLTVKFTSYYFNLYFTSTSLSVFPFLGEVASKPVYIIVPQSPSEDELYAAYRLWTYFDYYMGNYAVAPSGYATRPVVVRIDGTGYKIISFSYDFVTRTESTLNDTIGANDYVVKIRTQAGEVYQPGIATTIIIQYSDSKSLFTQCDIMMRRLESKYTVAR